MHLRPILELEANDALADLYSEDRQALGFLPEYSQVFSHHPDAYSAWRQLTSPLRGSMDLRRCELVTLAAARTLRSSYCTTAHGKVLSERWYEEDRVVATVTDHRSAGPDPGMMAPLSLELREALLVGRRPT